MPQWAATKQQGGACGGRRRARANESSVISAGDHCRLATALHAPHWPLETVRGDGEGTKAAAEAEAEWKRGEEKAAAWRKDEESKLQ